MENYKITKEQILELHESNSPETRIQIAKMFPDAFKKELEVGKWYKILNLSNYLLNYQGEDDKDIHYGFCMGNWDNYFFDILQKENYVEATDDEVRKALGNEVIKRFGKYWGTAKIEKCLVHSNPNPDYSFISLVTTSEIWNKNGCIYKNGVFAEPLKTKVITIEKAEKILSKKYGKKVEIK